MTIAVLCPGPSLQETWKWNATEYDLVFAVNAAGIPANGINYDYWVSMDAGTPGLDAERWPVDIGRDDLLRHCPEGSGTRGIYTVPALCWFLRAVYPTADVEFFGMDMEAGRPGLDGVIWPRQRWQKEVKQLNDAWDDEHFFRRTFMALGEAEKLAAAGKKIEAVLRVGDLSAANGVMMLSTVYVELSIRAGMSQEQIIALVRRTHREVLAGLRRPGMS